MAYTPKKLSLEIMSLLRVLVSKHFFEQNHFPRWLGVYIEELEEYRMAEASFLQEHVKQGSDLLDVGCGTGKSIEPVVGKVRHAYGIDFSASTLKKAKELLGGRDNVTLIRAGAEKLPFETPMFDYVICMGNTYGIFANPSDCLSEMIRVLRPDGEIILSVYSKTGDALRVQIESYLATGLVIKDVDKEKVSTQEHLISRRFSETGLKKIAKEHGLRAEVIELTPISYVAILKKKA